MLLDGVDAAALLATPELLEDDDDRWEGLDKGPDAAYLEALEAYVEVCADARCDKRFTQTWQRHATAIFAEALMELVATYRSSRPLHATTAVAESTEVDISANMALLEQQAQAQIQVDEVAATVRMVKAEVSAFGEVPPRSPCPMGRDETLNVLTVITKATTVEATSVSPLKMPNMPEQPAPRPLSHGDEAHVPEAATTEPAATANVIVADAQPARAAIAKFAPAKAARPEVSVAEVAAAEATVAKATVAEGAAFEAAASDAAATDAAASQTAEQAAAAAAAAAAESPQKPPAPADAPAATAASAVAAPSSAPMVLPTSGCNSSTGTATVSLAMGAATATEGGKEPLKASSSFGRRSGSKMSKITRSLSWNSRRKKQEEAKTENSCIHEQNGGAGGAGGADVDGVKTAAAAQSLTIVTVAAGVGSAGGVRAPCTNRRLQSNHLPAFSLMWRRGGETHRSEGWAHKGKPAYSGHYPNAVDRGCTWTRNVRCDRNKPESVPAHRKSCTKDRKRPKHKRTTNDTHRRPCRFASSSPPRRGRHSTAV